MYAGHEVHVSGGYQKLLFEPAQRLLQIFLPHHLAPPAAAWHLNPTAQLEAVNGMHGPFGGLRVRNFSYARLNTPEVHRPGWVPRLDNLKPGQGEYKRRYPTILIPVGPLSRLIERLRQEVLRRHRKMTDGAVASDLRMPSYRIVCGIAGCLVSGPFHAGWPSNETDGETTRQNMESMSSVGTSLLFTAFSQIFPGFFMTPATALEEDCWRSSENVAF
jgi:hypothetical protein